MEMNSNLKVTLTLAELQEIFIAGENLEMAWAQMENDDEVELNTQPLDFDDFMKQRFDIDVYEFEEPATEDCDDWYC